MKALNIFSILFLVLFSAFNSSASQADLFQLNEQELSETFKDLDKLEQMLSEKEPFESQSFLIQNLESAHPLNAIHAQMIQDKSKIPSFAFGFVFSAFGVFGVALLTKDQKETKKAFWGCLASSPLIIVIGVAACTENAIFGWHPSCEIDGCTDGLGCEGSSCDPSCDPNCGSSGCGM